MAEPLTGGQEEHVREIVQQEIRTFAALLAYELGAVWAGLPNKTRIGEEISTALTKATDRLLKGEVQ